MSNLLKTTAKELCAAFYVACERSPKFRTDAPPLKDFVMEHWPKYVEVARATLAAMLLDKSRPEKDKAAIYDALILDQAPQTLMRSADEATTRQVH